MQHFFFVFVALVVKSHKKFFCTVQPGVCYAGLCTEFSGIGLNFHLVLNCHLSSSLLYYSGYGSNRRALSFASIIQQKKLL